MDANYLQHHGIKGMRWGIRRFQRKDGSLTPAGKKRYDDDEKEETPEEFEARKQKALSSGSAKDVLEFQGKLTNQELQTAISRINYEKQLKDLTVDQRKSAADTMKSLASKLEDVNNTANKGINLWNTAAKVLNTLTDADLPVLDGTNKKDKAINAAKKKLIESGTPEEVAKHFGKFTVSELGDISKRFNFEDNIRARAKKDSDAAKAKAEEDARKRAEKEATEKAKEFYSTNTADVQGEGTSKRKTDSSETKANKKSKDTILDAEWVDLGYDTPITDVTVSTRAQSFIAGLLEDTEK